MHERGLIEVDARAPRRLQENLTVGEVIQTAIGQERPVTIYRLIMQDSIEERILHLHRDKRDLASELLEGAEMAGRLSEEALLDLIRA